jgi:hypothetical protein
MGIKCIYFAGEIIGGLKDAGHLERRNPHEKKINPHFDNAPMHSMPAWKSSESSGSRVKWLEWQIRGTGRFLTLRSGIISSPGDFTLSLVPFLAISPVESVFQLVLDMIFFWYQVFRTWLRFDIVCSHELFDIVPEHYIV